MPVTIKNRWTGKDIATVEDTDSIREAVIRLTKQGIDLKGAYLGKIFVSRVAGNRVTVGVEAPEDVRIIRGELKPEPRTATAEVTNDVTG